MALAMEPLLEWRKRMAQLRGMVMHYRRPNPFDPHDAWDPQSLSACLIAEVPGVVGVSVRRSLEGALATETHRRHVVVGLQVLRGEDVEHAKRRALDIVAVGCPPSVSAVVDGRTVDSAPEPPPRPEAEVPRRRAEMESLEPEAGARTWWRPLSYVWAAGAGAAALAILESL